MAAQSIVAGAAAALVIGLAGWMASAIALLAVGGSIDAALPALALFMAAGVGYAAIFVPLGYLVPRALLVGVGYILVLETILAFAVEGLAQLSIWRISLSIYAGLEDGFGEVAEAAMAIEMGADAADIGLTVHPHPTLSETVGMSAEAFEGTITDLYMPKRKKRS